MREEYKTLENMYKEQNDIKKQIEKELSDMHSFVISTVEEKVKNDKI
jgi:hypothetical protein